MTVDEDRNGRDLYGPVCYHSLKNRPHRCTDVPCCVIFLVFLIFLVISGIVAVIFGSPLRLLYGHDSFGNICGTTNEPIDSRALTGLDMTNKSFVFSFDIGNPRDSLKICVRRCPNQSLSTLTDLEKLAQREKITLCRYDFPVSNYRLSDSVNVSTEECTALRQVSTDVEILKVYSDNSGCLVKINQWRAGYGTCPKLPVMPSFPILNRCVPDKDSAAAGIIYDFYAYLNSFDFFSQVMADLYASHREIIGLSVAVLSGIFLAVLYFHTQAIVYVILTLVTLATTVGTALLWWAWSSLKASLDLRNRSGQHNVLLEETSNEVILLLFAIAATVMTVGLLIMLCIMRPKTNRVVRMFEQATACIKGVPWLLLQPVWTFLMLAAFFTLWCYVMLCLATSEIPRLVKRPIVFEYLSSNSAKFREIPDTSFTTIEYDNKTPVRFLWIFYVFALIWISEFILACQQMVVAGAISMWYFEKEKSQCRNPILVSLRQMICYHLGSIAMGSLLITIFKIPRLIVLHIKQFIQKRRSSRDSKDCCRSCWDSFLSFISHDAYAVIVVQGTVNFLPAGAEAQSLLDEIRPPMLGVNYLGDFVLLLGKCAVAGIIAVMGVVSMKYDPQLHLFAVPLLLCLVFAYFIAHSVLSVYEMAVDTIFLCYCEDLRLSEACQSSPDEVDNRSPAFSSPSHFASPSLKQFMDGVDANVSENLFRKPMAEET